MDHQRMRRRGRRGERAGAFAMASFQSGVVHINCINMRRAVYIRGVVSGRDRYALEAILYDGLGFLVDLLLYSELGRPLRKMRTLLWVSDIED